MDLELMEVLRNLQSSQDSCEAVGKMNKNEPEHRLQLRPTIGSMGKNKRQELSFIIKKI